jgi:peroxiredoxin
MLGKAVPDFNLASSGRSPSPATFKLCALRGEKLVLYSYPKFRHAGARVFGISRAALGFLDGNGVLARAWRGVKVPGHAQEVLNFVKAL